MRENDTNSWHKGINIVNYQVNNRPHEGRDNLTPYNIYYCLREEGTMEEVLGADGASNITTEIGWMVVSGVLNVLKKHHPTVEVTVEHFQQMSDLAEELHDREVTMSPEERESYDINGEVQKLIQHSLFNLCGVEETYAEDSDNEQNEGDSRDEEDNEADENEEDEQEDGEEDDGEEEEEGEQDEDALHNDRLQYRDDVTRRAGRGQERQAIRCNRGRGREYKEVLEENDICLVNIPAKVRGATDKKCIAVMVTQVIPYTNPRTNVTNYRYKCLTSKGYLNKNMDRSALEYRPSLTADLMGIDVNTADKNTKLSLEQANNQINQLGGAKERQKVVACRCTTDCSKSQNCGCRKARITCTSKCHGGRGGNIYCQLCTME